MNLLGRLFIVLIFVGSVMFMAMSITLYATHTNWRVRATDLEAKLKAKTEELAGLRKQAADMESALRLEIVSQANRNGALVARVRQLTQDNEDAKDDLADLRAELDKRITVAQNALNETGLLRVRFDEASKSLIAAQNDWVAMFTDLIKKTDEAHGLAIQVANYQTISSQLAKDYRDAVEVLRRLDVPADLTLYATQPPAGIRGTVTEVRPGGFVEISIGSDSGVVKGHHLDIIRHREGRSSYIGKIEITSVVADRAVAKIMPEFRRGVVQRDDEVTYIDVNELVAH